MMPSAPAPAPTPDVNPAPIVPDPTLDELVRLRRAAAARRSAASLRIDTNPALNTVGGNPGLSIPQ